MGCEPKRIADTQKHITTVEDAVLWCSEESADVEFSSNSSVPRVWIKVAGHPVVLRGTFLDAVHVLCAIVHKHKSEEYKYIW